jgi:hypothetical protein
MLDVYAHNLLCMKRFHGTHAGNAHNCLLQSSIGKVSDLQADAEADSQPASL